MDIFSLDEQLLDQYTAFARSFMPDIATNALPVAFGNWRRAYTLVDRAELALIVNNVTVPGQTSFYLRRRVGGCVTNNDALKFLKTTIA